MSTDVVEDLGKDLEDARREIEQLKKDRDSVEKDLRAELEEEQTKNQRLRELVSAAQAHVEALKADKQELTTNVGNLQSQLESSEREKQDLTTTVGNLQNQLNIAQTESLNLTTQVENLETELGEAQTHNQNLTTQVENLETELGEAQTHNQNLTTQVENLETELGEAQTHNQNLTTQVENLETELGEAQTHNQNLTTQVENLETELGEAQTHNQNLTTQVENLETDLGDAQTQSQNLTTQVENLETDLGDAQTQSQHLQTQLDEALRNNTYLLNDVFNQCTEIQHLTTQIQRNHPYRSLQCCILLIVMYFSIGITFCVWYAKSFIGMIKGGNVYVNAIYYMVITAFTIGFGDIHPDDMVTKLFTCFFVVLGFHVVNILIILQSYVWTKLKNKYLSTVSEPKRTRIITGLAVVAVFCSIFGGMMGICVFENGENVNRIQDYTMNSTDSFYLSVMSLSTEGFGDISFKTLAGRVFAVTWLVMFQPMYFSAMKYLMNLAVETIIGYCCCCCY